MDDDSKIEGKGAMSRLTMIAAFVLAVAACGKEPKVRKGTGDIGRISDDTAVYTIVLKSKWTAASHPYEYPAAQAHFSGMMGAAHNASFSLFAEGSTPTPGLERLSEEGKHVPLEDEIRAAISTGGVGMKFESPPLRDFKDSLTTRVWVDGAYPLVSLVAMVAPSPDWFTGVANVNLKVNGAWVPSLSLQLNAYDSGGDDGTTYLADNRDTNPKKPVSRAMTKHFVADGQVVPVATVTFTKR